MMVELDDRMIVGGCESVELTPTLTREVPVDLVIDHSVQVDVARSPNVVHANMELELQRNKKMLGFYKLGSNAFDNMLVVLPGYDIVHQGISTNLEEVYHAPIFPKLSTRDKLGMTKRQVRRLCVIAGNISPIDVITHVPIISEENDIPYVYVTSKEELATAGVTKRPTCCVLVTTKPTKGELEKEVQEKLQSEYNQIVPEVKELAASGY